MLQGAGWLRSCQDNDGNKATIEMRARCVQVVITTETGERRLFDRKQFERLLIHLRHAKCAVFSRTRQLATIIRGTPRARRVEQR